MREKILVVLKLLPWLMLLAAPEVMARTILVFGDSLSAGYGIRQEAAWPALLQNRLQERRFDYSVVNASISGETTAGGRSRLEAALSKHQPSVLVLALGANDGLRGLPLAVMRDNLAAMIKAARRQQIKVLLVGMRLPPILAPMPTTSTAASPNWPGRRSWPTWISCWTAWRTNPSCSRRTTCIPWPKPSRACSTMCGRGWRPCSAGADCKPRGARG